MILDRHEPGARQPVGSPGAKRGQNDGHLVGRADPEGGDGVAVADLHCQVRAVERGECVFVGDVVAQEHHRVGPDVAPHGVQGSSLVGRNQLDLADHLSVAHCQFADVFGQLVDADQDAADDSDQPRK